MMVSTIHELREAKGLTQHQFANRLGVGSGTALGWERGTHRPTQRHLRQIAVVLGVAESTIMIVPARPL